MSRLPGKPGGAGTRKRTDNIMNALLEICGIPTFIEPWLSRFYTKTETDLLQALSGKAMTAHEIKTRLGSEYTREFIQRAWKRGVLRKTDDGRVAPAEFHIRFESWALFEGWQDLPLEIKDRLNQWELDYYLNRHHPIVTALKERKSRPLDTACPEYLLLDEVTGLFDRIGQFYLWPCNCRAMMGSCQNPIYTCLRFSN